MGQPGDSMSSKDQPASGEVRVSSRGLKGDAPNSPWLRKWSWDLDHPYISVILLVLIAFGLRLALDPVLLERSPFLIFTAAVVIGAGRYGTGPGLLATILSVVLGTVMFLAPGHPGFLASDQIASLAVFIVTSAAMLVFAGLLKASRESERQLQAALQQRHTESAMGSMAATLAHELNQPLAAAANYVGAGKRMAASLEGDSQATLMAGLTEAETQIQRAGQIIRHARDLVTNVSAVREPASLRTLLDNVLKPLEASGTCRNIRLRTDIEDEADTVFVNPIQIEQVLLNVIRNACQAAKNGNAPEIAVSAKAQDDACTVEVRDFGPGISNERMKTLFSPAGKSSDGGLGLGLSISRTIVEAHGGKMWAKNNPEGGASFFFTIGTKPAGP
jgi:signal transduction histidine kinase